MVVAAGGQDRHGEDPFEAEVYDPLKNVWTPLPDVPAECRGATTGWELEGCPDVVVVCVAIAISARDAQGSRSPEVVL